MSAAYDFQASARNTKANKAKLVANIKAVNIAEDLDGETLAKMGAKVVEEYDLDFASRDAAGWTVRNKAAMDLALQVKTPKTYPWPGASNVKYPLLATAAIQFNARAYPAIVDGANVVKARVLGEDPDEQKADRADRISAHMSWQLLEEMQGWEEDTDRLLINLPIAGCAFRKTYFDPVAGINCSHMITADKLVVNYWAKDIESVPRITEVCTYYPHEVLERVRGGLWLDAELGQPQGDDTRGIAANDDLAPHTFLEQHRLWDLDQDGYPEPYIVTVHKETKKVVRVVARYDETGIDANQKGEVVRIKAVRYYTKYGFIPAPDGSFYDIGFGQLLDAIGETINTTFNQLMDAGHLQNVQGGFIGQGVTFKGGSMRFQPGEWKRMENTGQAMRDAVFPLPVTPPSAVLFQLLGMLIEASKDITATKDILTGETQGQNQPVGTTLATIEQGLKVFTAIYKRVHRALKQELACLYRLNRVYLNDKQYFNFQDVQGVVAREDYADDIGVEPVSDPTMVSDMQRIKRAEYLMPFANDPIMNKKEIIERALRAGSIPDIKALFNQNPSPPPEALIEAAKVKNDANKLALGHEQHKLAEKAHDLDVMRFGMEKANAEAANTLKYAQALAATSGIGVPTLGTPETPATADAPAIPGTDPTPTANPHGADAFANLHGRAINEMNTAIAEVVTLDEQDDSQDDGTVQQGDIPGMAGPSPNGAPPQVPQGQPAGAGGPMDGGGAPGPGPADQGPPDGGASGPSMGIGG